MTERGRTGDGEGMEEGRGATSVPRPSWFRPLSVYPNPYRSLKIRRWCLSCPGMM